MKKNKSLIFGLVFFLFAFIVIIFSGIRIIMFPTQEVELSNNADFGKLLPGTVFIQAITMHKDFLEQVDLYFGRINNDGLNESVVVLVDEARQMIFSRRLSSSEIVKADYYSFQLKKPVKIGKGKKVFVCMSSIDGDLSNCLTIPLNKQSKFGVFSVARIQNNDLMSTIANPLELTKLDGSIGVKTHEISNPTMNFSFFILLVFAGGITMIVIFNKFFKRLLSSIVLRPEYTFIFIAAVFGLIFLYITPPFQTPDEPAHFYRAYQLSTLNFSRKPDDVPKSLQTITALGERMKFKSWEKTSKAEILAFRNIKLSSEIRIQVETVNFTIPYIPQALGMSIARIFSDAPIWYLYTGRIFNLLVAIGLIFIAIKIIPVHKWLIFMLGVMPMTISQIASSSYDASTIGLSFLLFALILRQAFGEKEKVSNKEILSLFLLTILLAFCKPPYFLISLGFLIIPVRKIGSMRKFILILVGLMISGILVSQFWSSTISAMESVFVSNAKAMTVAAHPSDEVSSQIQTQNQTAEGNRLSQQKEPQRQTSGGNQTSNQDEPQRQAPSGGQTSNQAEPQIQTNEGAQHLSEPAPPPMAANPFNSEAQLKFISSNPLRYFGIIVNSIIKYWGLYMTSFVGLFGWNDTALPDLLVYLFMAVLILSAFNLSDKKINIDVRKKAIFASVYTSCFLLIETGLYLYSNKVGSPNIIGVQGRYFIPLAPLFLIMCYSNSFEIYLGKYFHSTLVRPAKNKTGTKIIQHNISQDSNVSVKQVLPWVLLLIAIFSLAYSIIIILNRFYIITC